MSSNPCSLFVLSLVLNITVVSIAPREKCPSYSLFLFHNNVHVVNFGTHISSKVLQLRFNRYDSDRLERMTVKRNACCNREN